MKIIIKNLKTKKAIMMINETNYEKKLAQRELAL